MRVLFLAPQPFLRERGTPLRARNILATMTAAGHTVEMLCYPFGDDVEMPGLRILRSARVPGIRDVGIGPSAAKIVLDVPFALRALRMCARRGVDVIQAVEEAGLFAWVPARLLRRPFVYQMDSWITEQLVFSGFATRGPALALARWLERAAMRTAALVITVGPDHAAEVHRIAPRADVLVLPDTPGADRFVPDEAGAARWRERLALGRARCAVYTGNFEPYQGVELLVRAAAQLPPACADVRIVLVGGRPDQIRDLQALAREVGAAERCVFAGSQPPHEMTAVLTLADVLVSPRCRGRNPPMKIYTYMQAGRPIVATRVPTHTQVLDEEIALLADPDPAALAATLASAFADASRAARVAAAALERFEREYSPARFRERIVSALDRVAAARSARHGV